MADAGLVLLNLHFVSDVAAGTFVGVSAGLFTVGLLRGSLWARSLFGHFHPLEGRIAKRRGSIAGCNRFNAK
jgi:membrane-associated phospholipid phosphatase